MWRGNDGNSLDKRGFSYCFLFFAQVRDFPMIDAVDRLLLKRGRQESRVKSDQDECDEVV